MNYNIENIAQYVNQQLKNILISEEDVTLYIEHALERTYRCFEKSKNKYYSDSENRIKFSLFHSGQYSIFLYYLSNTLYKYKEDDLATKIYYLNKILHSVDWYYEIELPEYWIVEHPIASVLGRADYSNGLVIYQGCTIGGNRGKYPTLGKNVILYSNATILGNSKIGNNVVLSTGCTIKDQDIPDNCLVFGVSPNLIIKNKGYEFMEELICQFWKN